MYQQTKRWFFFLFVFKQMLLHHSIIYIHTYTAANFGVHAPTNTSLPTNLYVRMFSFCLKLISFRRNFKSLENMQYFNHPKFDCAYGCKWVIPAWPRNLKRKHYKLLSQQSKQFWVSNSVGKSTIFRVCVQLFGKNSMVQEHVILLYIHSTTVRTWMSAKSGAQTTEFSMRYAQLSNVAKMHYHSGQIANSLILPKLLVIF